MGTVAAEAAGRGYGLGGSQGGDISVWGGGGEMARQRGWAVGEHSRLEPVFLSEYRTPADFSHFSRWCCPEGLGR